MEIEHLKYFVTVARMEHMSKAAEVLNISQPALSNIIKRLEFDLGVPLFDRQGRSIKLNEFGKAFYSNITPALTQFDMALTEIGRMKNQSNSEIRIVAPLLYSFPHLIPNLRDVGDDISIISVDMSYPTIRDALLSNAIDFCVLARPIDNEGLSEVILTDDELVLLVSEDNPMASLETADLQQFKDCIFVDYQQIFTVKSEMVAFCEQAGFTPKIAYTGHALFDLIEAVKHSRYVAMVPYRMLYRYRTEGTLPIRISSPVCKSHIHMYWNPNAPAKKYVEEARNVVIRYFERYKAAEKRNLEL